MYLIKLIDIYNILKILKKIDDNNKKINQKIKRQMQIKTKHELIPFEVIQL